MRFPRWAAGPMAVAASAITLTSGLVPAGPAAADAQPPQPVVKLAIAQRSVTLTSFDGSVFLDPGIWVATLRAPLVFHVQRAGYTKPVRITQVISSPSGGTVQRELPSSVLDGWNGLREFMTMTVKNSSGKAVRTVRMPFCPNSFDPQRLTPDGPTSPKYPEACGGDPFIKAQVWGLQQGWAVDPAESASQAFMKLAPGVYHVTSTVSPQYRKLFGIRSADATASVTVTVKKGSGHGEPRKTGGPESKPLPANPAVPTVSDPPASALPDLIPLPSWGISTSNLKSGHSLLDFGATVWIDHARLDVQGFRSNGSPTMKAYQYFWQNGKLIGRTRAGTMGFDTGKGHEHWHFEQFAQYRLLGKTKKLVVRSHKQGFCIAATDGVNQLLPGINWRPSFNGFVSFSCGDPSALWVREMMPLGWGDTYTQSVAGQAFDITDLPNGTYYIEVIANPEKVLHETSTKNDASLRKVILGGTAGHRTVKVPPWNGMDREG